MKTEVIMKRELFGSEISQKSQSEFLSATDLVKAGNLWRISNGLPLFNLAQFLQTKAVKEFIASLERIYGKVKINAAGKNRHTWVHPFLFIEIALALSPDLKIEVYSWLYDHLLKYRNDSGDSYKRMVGALWARSSNKSVFPRYVQGVADTIRGAVGVNDWNSATEKQLEVRDRIHENVSLLADIVPLDDAVRIGIKKALEHDVQKEVI